MNPMQIKDENSFLYHRYFSVIFYEFISNSKKNFNFIIEKDKEKWEERFKEYNRQNKKKYELRKNMLIKYDDDNIKNMKIILKSLIGLDIDDLEDKEEIIFQIIKQKIIDNFKELTTPKIPFNDAFNHLMSVYYSDYIIDSFILIIKIIKIMKENELKKILKKQLNSLRKEIKIIKELKKRRINGKII